MGTSYPVGLAGTVGAWAIVAPAGVNTFGHCRAAGAVGTLDVPCSQANVGTTEPIVFLASACSMGRPAAMSNYGKYYYT